MEAQVLFATYLLLLHNFRVLGGIYSYGLCQKNFVLLAHWN